MLRGLRMESPTPMHEGPTSPSASAQVQRRPSRHGSILLDVVGSVASSGAARGGAFGALSSFGGCQECVVDFAGGGHIPMHARQHIWYIFVILLVTPCQPCLTVDRDHPGNFAGVSSCFCAFLRVKRAEMMMRERYDDAG
jgi:hypothetical protein